MATVYLADDLRHGRQVAIKVLRPELGALLGPDRFTREIRVAAWLNHPHILPLYDRPGPATAGDAGQLYYVMPYVAGRVAPGEAHRRTAARDRQGDRPRSPGRLGAGPRARPRPDPSRHQAREHPAPRRRGDGHRLRYRDRRRELAAGERLTETGLMLGTPEYMSPEQAAGERTLDARSDVYSLGCVLYELLAGEPPHAATTARSVIARRLTEPAPARPPRPADRARRRGRRRSSRALAPDPADRFPTAAAFADALTAPRADRVPRPPSVAVLPFDNLSTDPENEFFADGITEDVIAQLSKIRSLKVISRSSVMRFKRREQSLREIGATLDVDDAARGQRPARREPSPDRGAAHRRRDGPASLGRDLRPRADRHLRDPERRRAADRGRARGGAHPGRAETDPQGADRRRPGLPAVSPRPAMPTRWTQEGVDQGLKYLEQAIERDPDYALAYATIAFTYTDLGLGVAGAIPSDEAFRRAKAAVVAGARDRQRPRRRRTPYSGYLKIALRLRLGGRGEGAQAGDRAQPEQWRGV